MWWNKLPDKSDELLRFLASDNGPGLSDPKLQRLAEKWKQPGYGRQKSRQQQRYDYQRAYLRLARLRQRQILYRTMRWAAILLLPLGLGLAAYFYFVRPSGQPHGQTCAVVKPGGTKAILTLANGQEVKLTGQTGELLESRAAVIMIDSTGLHYAPQKEANPAAENRIRVPRGGEYRLTLSDGTKVWLNADSELKYPVVFTGDKRKVTVVGEAYLEVSPNPTAPFTVETALGAVEVLGTKFNIQAYREEKRVVTTLVEGSVACRQWKEEKIVVLQPDQQVILDEWGIGEVRQVKTQQYTGWKDGLFVFENERLEDILRQLSRWYDIRVNYTDASLKELHFSGDLSRFKDIGIFFRMFENSADISFSLQGKDLTVSAK